MKTPPRDPCKRTRRTSVVHLGAFKSQLVATVVLYIYLFIYVFILIYVTNLVACYRTQFLTDLFKDPFLSSVCVCLCLRAYQHICMFVFFTSSITFYTRKPCLSLATKTLTYSQLLILTSTLHNEHVHMISSNILMNIFMQVFGVCKSYNYITHLSTYTPTSSLMFTYLHVRMSQSPLIYV